MRQFRGRISGCSTGAGTVRTLPAAKGASGREAEGVTAAGAANEPVDANCCCAPAPSVLTNPSSTTRSEEE